MPLYVFGIQLKRFWRDKRRPW